MERSDLGGWWLCSTARASSPARYNYAEKHLVGCPIKRPLAILCTSCALRTDRLAFHFANTYT